jgi:hypothetical protein
MRHAIVVQAMRVHFHSAHQDLYLQSNLLAGSDCLEHLPRTEILGAPLLSPFLAAEYARSCTINF